MSEQFIENLIKELNISCLNKESKTFSKWNRTDIDLDIEKCRKYCDVDSGYVWNGVKICESCDKNLHLYLDKFKKSNFDLIFDNINLENKVNELNNNISDIKKNLKELEISKIKIDYFEKIIESLIKKQEDINKNINNKFNDNNKFIENLLNASELKYKNIIESEKEKNIDLDNKYNMLNNKYNDLTNQNKNLEEKYINFINNKNIIDNNNIINNNIDNNIDNNDYLNFKKNKVLNNKFIKSLTSNDNKQNNIINKQINYQNNLNNLNNINNSNNSNNFSNLKNNKNIFANIKIFDKYKIGGIGNVLVCNTTTNGNVKVGYTYQSKSNENIIFKIKSFENNFCPTEYTYPDSNIEIIPQFIKGYITDIELYDEYVCIKTE